MNILALIPARMNSSRFPGKPLAAILDKPMIGHVYEQVIKADILTCTAVATCDQVIANYITSIDGVAIMTGNHHERATDRCAEALVKLQQQNKIEYDIVVMIQGDEPMVRASMIQEAVEPLLRDKNILLTNLMAPISTIEEYEDKNCVKVVCDLKNDALYFSREAIPTSCKTMNGPKYKQVAIMAFQSHFLLQYAEMQPTVLEIVESIDVLRVLEHGLKIRMVPTQQITYAVDTPQDRDKVERCMQSLARAPL